MNKVHVHPTAVVDKTAIIGYDTKVWRFVHVRENAEIGRGCVLGDFVYVGRDVKIGNGVKLENRATVYREVKIERKVFSVLMSPLRTIHIPELQHGLENRGNTRRRGGLNRSRSGYWCAVLL